MAQIIYLCVAITFVLLTVLFGWLTYRASQDRGDSYNMTMKWFMKWLYKNKMALYILFLVICASCAVTFFIMTGNPPVITPK